MLQKGWRCLDCTVCEGCGKPHDESRLILCDECDISFHIYCLDPPLTEVPQGAWKCKWCIVCVTCGATSPGVVDGCAWQNNYSQCAKCASLEMCPVCSVSYTDGELILQCSHCERFVHSLFSRLLAVFLWCYRNLVMMNSRFLYCFCLFLFNFMLFNGTEVAFFPGCQKLQMTA